MADKGKGADQDHEEPAVKRHRLEMERHGDAGRDRTDQGGVEKGGQRVVDGTQPPRAQLIARIAQGARHHDASGDVDEAAAGANDDHRADEADGDADPALQPDPFAEDRLGQDHHHDRRQEVDGVRLGQW